MSESHPTMKLSLLAGGELGESESAAVRVHIDACESCRVEFDSLISLQKLFDAASYPDVPREILGGFKEDVMRSIRVRERSNFFEWFASLLDLFRRPAFAAAVAIIVLVVAASFWLLSGPAREQVPNAVRNPGRHLVHLMRIGDWTSVKQLLEDDEVRYAVYAEQVPVEELLAALNSLRDAQLPDKLMREATGHALLRESVPVAAPSDISKVAPGVEERISRASAISPTISREPTTEQLTELLGFIKAFRKTMSLGELATLVRILRK